MHPALPAVGVLHVEPVRAALQHADLFAALDDVDDGEAAAGPGAQFQEGIGDDDLEPVGPGCRDTCQAQEQRAGDEPRHRLS